MKGLLGNMKKEYIKNYFVTIKNILKVCCVIIVLTSCSFILVACNGSNAMNPESPPNDDVNVTEPEPETDTTIPSPSTNQADSGNSAFGAYISVLEDNSTFFSTDVNKNLTLNQLINSFGDASMEITKFAVVDLDNDGIPEVTLWETVNNNVDYGVEILHYQNGAVYSYSFVYRAFNNLKTDGTFSFSSSAADSGFGTVNLNDGSYTFNKITYSEQSPDSDAIIFFVNNKIATADEFDSAMDEQNMNADIKWYDFTEENIETMLADSD